MWWFFFLLILNIITLFVLDSKTSQSIPFDKFAYLFQFLEMEIVFQTWFIATNSFLFCTKQTVFFYTQDDDNFEYYFVIFSKNCLSYCACSMSNWKYVWFIRMLSYSHFSGCKNWNYACENFLSLINNSGDGLIRKTWCLLRKSLKFVSHLHRWGCLYHLFPRLWIFFLEIEQ